MHNYIIEQNRGGFAVYLDGYIRLFPTLNAALRFIGLDI